MQVYLTFYLQKSMMCISTAFPVLARSHGFSPWASWGGWAASSSSGEMKERNRDGEGNSPRPCAQLMPERDTLHAFDFPTDPTAWTLISYQMRAQKGSWTWGHLPSRAITDMVLLPSASLGTHIPSVPHSGCSSGNRTARLASAFWTLGNRGWNELQGIGLVPEGVLSTS